MYLIAFLLVQSTSTRFHKEIPLTVLQNKLMYLIHRCIQIYTDVLENTYDVSKYALKIHRCIQIYIDVLQNTLMYPKIH